VTASAKPSPPSPTPGFARERTITFLLGAIAGLADTASFFALFGLFTAHVTGNLVTAGSALARRTQDGVAAKLAMLPIFMAAVALATLIVQAMRRRGADPLVALLALMTAMLAVFWGVGVALEPYADGPDSWAVIVIGGAGVVALGVQNALMREAFGTLSPTTVMTGNLTQFTIDLVQIYSPSTRDPEARASERRASVRGLAKFGWPLLGFVLGAAAGAWATGQYRLWSLSVPTVVSLGLTAAACRRSRDSIGVAG
jgi:uncharacterized membrane protein YoaK (UPF0700 family)